MKAVRNYRLWDIHDKEDGDDEKVKKTKNQMRRHILVEVDETTEVMKKWFVVTEQYRCRSKMCPEEDRSDSPSSAGDTGGIGRHNHGRLSVGDGSAQYREGAVYEGSEGKNDGKRSGRNN